MSIFCADCDTKTIEIEQLRAELAEAKQLLSDIQLAIKAGMTCYGGANLPPWHHSWQAYTPHIEKLVILAQAQALRDAADSFDNYREADGRSIQFANALRRMAEELSRVAGCSYAGNAPTLRDVAKVLRHRP